jgi:hypothetical protein
MTRTSNSITLDLTSLLIKARSRRPTRQVSQVLTRPFLLESLVNHNHQSSQSDILSNVVVSANRVQRVDYTKISGIAKKQFATPLICSISAYPERGIARWTARFPGPQGKACLITNSNQSRIG